MIKKCIFLYLSSIIFLFLINNISNNKFYSFRKKNNTCPFKHTQLEFVFKNKKNYRLYHSFLCGNKKLIPRKTKSNYKILNLYHLFTPSGIHLSSVYLVLSPIFYLLNLLSPHLSYLIQILISLLSYTLNGFYSIKRICSIRAIQIISKIFKININIFYVFIFWFFIDYLFGTYQQSPLSWIYSFLFLGIILSSTNRPKYFCLFCSWEVRSLFLLLV